jgi:hypothetical protein
MPAREKVEVGPDSNSLSHLALRGRVPSLCYLPALQKLQITCGEEMNSRYLEQLLCPNLKDLQISCFFGKGMPLHTILKIFPLLQSLTILEMNQTSLPQRDVTFPDNIKIR